eukprot:411885_1
MKFILVFSIIQLILKQCTNVMGQNCVYTDPISGNKLYLDALQHTTLIHTANETIDQHTYTYTPCRNAAGECTDGYSITTSMCRQTLDNKPDVCNVIANMDSTVMPTYFEENSTWWFQFKNGDDVGCGANRVFNSYFVCDMTAGDYKIVSAGETTISCTYEFNIRTKWACPNQNYTTTTESPMDCSWSVNNGENILDLSMFDTDIIMAQLKSNNNLYYLYSPCRNQLKCNNTMNMIELNNGVTLICKQYLGIWNNTKHINVNYNSIDKSWQFIYTNGEKCSGFQSIMTIIWTCDESVDYYKVIKADTVAQCQNVMEIKSKNACS